MAKTKTADKPADLPETPAAAAYAGPGEPGMDVQALLAEVRSERDQQPGMAPPGDEVEVEAEGITAWHNGKKITAMWSNASNRNAYAAVQGMGWKKLSNANDSSFLALTMLAAHAEQTNSTVNLEIGSDNEIHQIYVW